MSKFSLCSAYILTFKTRLKIPSQSYVEEAKFVKKEENLLPIPRSQPVGEFNFLRLKLRIDT